LECTQRAQRGEKCTEGRLEKPKERRLEVAGKENYKTENGHFKWAPFCKLNGALRKHAHYMEAYCKGPSKEEIRKGKEP